MDNSVILQSDDELEDLESRRFDDGYSLSADVSESESSTSAATFSSDHRLPSACTPSSPLDLASSSDSLPPRPTLLPVLGGRHVITPAEKPDRDKHDPTELSEAELMKERFAKLLLGEDMSGGGKGVSTAVAISNAITNLAASVFGELWKLEPLSPQKRSMWQREMEWLLCVSGSIVELIPSLQELPGGESFEIMVTQQRRDLYVNLPALRKLDGMLMSILDGFHDTEFYYVDRGVIVANGEHIEACPGPPSSRGRPSITLEEKWWLPFPKVPTDGLREETRTRLKQCKECTQQIFKAAVAINDSVLSEMEVPHAYLESLPKNDKACLGEILYRYITADQFSPDRLLDYLDVSSEYSTLEIANRIESAVHFWRLKYQKKKLNHARTVSFWGNTMKGLVCDAEKSKLFAHRADTLLKNLKLHFPGLPQTALDMNKIQCNKDVGQSILESYSRVLESLAFNLTARIDDLLYVDDATKQRAMAESISMFNNQRRSMGAHHLHNQYSPTSLSSQNSYSSSSLTGSPFHCLVPVTQQPKRLRRTVSKSASRNLLDVELQKLAL